MHAIAHAQASARAAVLMYVKIAYTTFYLRHFLLVLFFKNLQIERLKIN